MKRRVMAAKHMSVGALKKQLACKGKHCKSIGKLPRKLLKKIIHKKNKIVRKIKVIKKAKKLAKIIARKEASVIVKIKTKKLEHKLNK